MAKVNVEFGATLDDLKSGVDEVNDSLDSIRAHAESVGEGFKLLAEIAGVTLSVEGVKTFIESMGDYAQKTQDSMARLGASAEQVTTLQGVATVTGSSFENLERSIEMVSLNLQKSARDAYGPAAQALRLLGISAKDLAGLPADQWMTKFADSVSRFNPSMNLTNALMAAGGKGMVQLLPYLLDGGEEFQRLAAAVREAQAGLAQAIPGMAETEQKLQLLGLGSKAFGAQVFTVLKPAIDAAIDGMMALGKAITPDQIRDAANTIGNGLIDIAASVAEFMVRAGVSVDIFKGKILSLLPSVDIMVDGIAADMVRLGQDINNHVPLGEMVEHLRENAQKPINFHVGLSNDAADPLAGIEDKLKTIHDYADRAHAALDAAVPKAGSWQAAGQDIARMTGEVTELAEGFTRLNAAPLNFGLQSQLAARAQAIEAEIQAEQSKYQRIKAIFDQEAASFKISQNEKAVFTETALEQEYQAELTSIGKKIALYAQGTKEYEAAEREKAKLTETYEKEMLALVQQSQKEMTTEVTQGLQAITGAFNSQLRGLLAGTTSWATAMKNIAADLFTKMIELVEQWAVKHAAAMIADALVGKTQAAADVATHAAAEAAKTEATVAGAAARASADAAGNSAGIAGQIANAVQSVTIDAGKVFAGVFGFLAPVMGPAAAGPAAASEAEALAAGLAPLAVGAWEIPSVMPALLHPGEMVVPQTFASGLRESFGGGGASGGGGGGAGGLSLTFQNFIGNQAFINQIMPQLAKAYQSYQTRTPSLAW